MWCSVVTAILVFDPYLCLLGSHADGLVLVVALQACTRLLTGLMLYTIFV
jgi:hypothetical protein